MTDEEQRHHDYVCAAMASMAQRGLECDHMPADIAQAAKAVADAMMEATAKPDDKDKPVCKWCRGEGQIKTFDQASQLLDIDWCPVCGGSGGAPMEPKPDDKDAEIARLTEANAKALTALKALQETQSGLPYLCDE